MDKVMIPIPAGSILTITTGAYSDYYVRGVFRAIKDIDAELLRLEWLTAHPDQAEVFRFETSDFLGWVALKGYLECVDAHEWHLGDYARIETMDVTKIHGEESLF